MTTSRRRAAALPTLATVADRAGVSRQTVSNALNNPELLRPDTLARVQAVIEELGYKPNRAARQLRTRSSHLLGLRVEPAREGMSTALIDRFVHTLVETAARTGHHILLFSGDPDDPLDGYQDLLRATAVDAFIVTDTYAGTPQADLLRGLGAPFVAFGRPWDEGAADHPWVDVDGAAGARAATEHLIARGHHRIAWLGWEESSRIGEDRRAGWEAAVREDAADRRHSWTADEAAALAVRLTDNVDDARMAAHQVLEDPSVTAFACVSDTIGIGVLHALHERGLRPGRDVAVVGFDDSHPARTAWPGLTSVRQPLEGVARELIDLVHQVLAHQPVVRPERMLSPTLVTRRSTQRDW